MLRLRSVLVALTFLCGLFACSPQATQTREASAGPAADDSQQKVEPAPLGSVAALHGATVSAIIARGKLLVGTSGQQPPFSMKNKAGELIGFEVDMARAFAASLGVEVEFVQMHFSEVLPAVESGKVDIGLSSITMTPERNLRVAFIGPYFVSGKALLTKDPAVAGAERIESLAQVKLAALKGSTSEEFIKRGAPQAQLVAFEDYDDAVRAVANDEVKALIADLPQIAVTILSNPDAGFVGVGDPMSFEPIGVAMPADDAHFHNLLENYLKMLEGVGALPAMRERWFGKGDWLPEGSSTSDSAPLAPRSSQAGPQLEM